VADNLGDPPSSGTNDMAILAHRYQRVLLLGVTAAVTFYLLLPLAVSYVLARELRGQGLKQVIVQLGYPGWRGMRVPVVSFQQDLGQETLMVSLTDADLQYRPLHLLQGQVDRVVLPYVAVQILHQLSGQRSAIPAGREPVEEEGSPWALLTAGDLLRRLPILPFDELRLDRLTLFREQATGPLRRVTISGVLVQQDGELGGHLSFQGQDTAPYGLTVAGHSASTWSATLASQRPQAAPIVAWQSSARPHGAQIQMEGRLEINVRELAPFIALLVPIGPELGRVTGQVAMSWAGTAASEATLLSIWEDPRTQVDGQVRAAMTLPALQGVAKDITLSWEGRFSGTSSHVAWTLDPGVLLTATVNVPPQKIPGAVRMLLPRGDQPVRIEQKQPVHGRLLWAESPLRAVAEGPLHVSYGRSPGPLIVEFETARAESVGQELSGVEGGFRVEGELSKAVTDQLAAKEATGGFHGTLSFAGSRVQVRLLPSSLVTAKYVEQGTISIPRATLQLTDPLPLQCDLDSGRCQAGPASIAIRVPAVHVMGRDLRMAHGTLAVQQAEIVGPSWNLHATLTAAGVAVDLPQGGVAATDWTAKLTADAAGLKADVRADAPSHEGLVIGTIEQPFGGGQGALRGTVDMRFDAGAGSLSRLMTGWPADVTDGRLTLALDASWSGVGRGFALKQTVVTATAEKLSGRYLDYEIKGLSTVMALSGQGWDSIEMAPAAVTVASVQTGIEVANLAMSVSGAWKLSDRLPVMEIKDIQCDVFGGAATSPGARIDWAKPPHRLTFSLRNLDLARILSVEQQKGLQGSGILNGTLPVTVTAAGVTIDDGTLEAESPGGIIRYGSMPESPKLITEADSHLHLVAQALNNFHYTVLRVGVDYAESGLLDLSVRLEGRNPDLKKSPPIHFNLAVQEHVPTLLKTLRLVKDLEESIQKKYKGPDSTKRGRGT
jgi:hypothetical protein